MGVGSLVGGGEGGLVCGGRTWCVGGGGLVGGWEGGIPPRACPGGKVTSAHQPVAGCLFFYFFYGTVR